MIGYGVDTDGVATLTWDMPGRSMNVLSHESVDAFARAMRRAIADDAVVGVVIASGKPDFIAGADLEMLLALREPEQVMELVEGIKAIYREMETAGKPFVAAINGTALGGGLELALACHRRITPGNPGAKLGLPEVTLGLLPGAGGTQRLPRMIGIEKALPLLLEGRHIDPAKALALGVVDEVVAPDALHASAKTWILEDGACEKPWYDKGYRPPGPTVQSPQGYEIFTAGNALLHGKTYGNYPAPKAIMSCVYEGMQVPIDVGLRVESRYLAHLYASKEARSMIRTLFFSMGEARKLHRRPKGVAPTQYSRIGVLGSGMMGSGVAYVAALAGLEVALLDTSIELAEKGKRYGAGVLDKRVERGRMTRDESDAILARITPSADFSALEGAELVIEAVFEDRDVKAAVTAKAEAMLGEQGVFASNTSTLPITGLAAAASRPEHFIGLHFFSPVDKMQLVEVILGEQTSDACLARSLDFVRRIGKVPIVVNDSLGFYTSRIVSRFVDEGIAMVAEGVKPALIENGGKLVGFPVGPLALADEVSLELLHAVRSQHRRDLGEAYQAHPGDAVIGHFVDGLRRLGRKSGGGFYDYPAGDKKRLWPGIGAQYALDNDQPAVEEVMKRLLYVQAVDAARCLDEGVLTDPRDGDVGSILGWGFPSYTGGAISSIDYVGAREFVGECDRMAATYGERFAPPDSLREMAQANGAFYPQP